MDPHGTRDGLRFVAAAPIDFSMKSRSSAEILGCWAGESNTTMNHKVDHNSPMTPIKIREIL